MEHHSNLLPWLQLKEKGVDVDIVSVSDDYELDMDYYKKLPKNTRLVALTHASNVTGTINDIKEIKSDTKGGSSPWKPIPNIPTTKRSALETLSFILIKSAGSESSKIRFYTYHACYEKSF